jgi:hypothetical protein
MDGGRGLVRQPFAGIGDGDFHQTAVLFTAVARHQPFFLQPVDNTDHCSGAQKHRLGQPGHRYRALFPNDQQTGQLRPGDLVIVVQFAGMNLYGADDLAQGFEYAEFILVGGDGGNGQHGGEPAAC